MCTTTYQEIISIENLCEAWQEFIRGKRQKKDVQQFNLHLGDEIVELHQLLKNGEYKHSDYAHFRINDPKPRDIHKASVRDRLLHHALHRKLYPFFAKQFISDSFSCQTGKGLHRAIDRFKKYSNKVSKNNTRTCWILKCDIRKFFASIDHVILINLIKQKMNDAKLVEILENIIRSFETKPGKGIPLGNLTSQLFANIYLNELDQYIKHDIRVQNYIRYADDFVLLSTDRTVLLHILPNIQAFLSGMLELRLHPDKISIQTLDAGVDFLGWIHFSHYRVPRTKTKIRMRKRIHKSPEHQSVQSYVGMLSHGNAHRLIREVFNMFWLLKQ